MPDASEVFYFADSNNNRQGPVSASDIVRLIGEGIIRADTLIWSANLVDWRQAAQVVQFEHLFARYTPPFDPPPNYAANASQSRGAPGATGFAGSQGQSVTPSGYLTADFEVWGLFWRLFLVAIGSFLIVPAPWVNTTYYRYIGVSTALPDGRRFTFSGRPGDIWLVFVGIAILGLLAQFVPYGGILLNLGSFALSVLVLRWFCSHLGTEDGTTRLTFEGGIWNYIGWNFLLGLSIVTIIGWAWVAKGLLQWLCQNVRGTLAFEFTGTGSAILWRSLAVVLASIFIIPIPWMARWYAAWIVSQIQVSAVRG